MKPEKFLKEAEKQCEISKKYFRPQNLCIDATSRAYHSIHISATYAVWRLLVERGGFKKPEAFFREVNYDNVKERKLGCRELQNLTAQRLQKLEYRDKEVKNLGLLRRYSDLILIGSWIEYCDWKMVEKSIKELKKLIRDVERLLPNKKTVKTQQKRKKTCSADYTV